MPSKKTPTLVTVYVRWTCLRAVLHRGWWLVASLYLVVEANLDPLQLVFLGTAQGLTVILLEIPTGIVADNYSRKWSVVISHVLMGIGMLATGLVTSFHALIITQMIWGLSWTFSSGADVAWLTDEVNQPREIGRFLSIAARWGQVGAAFGISLFGLLAWLTTLATSMVIAGLLMLCLGVYVALRFTENNFNPSHKNFLQGIRQTLKEGVTFAKADRTIILILSVTFLVNGADEVFSRLFAKQLLELGLPLTPDPVVWLTLLGLVTLAVGATTLRLIENHLNGAPSLRKLYFAACLLGLFGFLLFAMAPDYLTAMAGVIVVHGLAWNVVSVVGIIWINERSENHVRATLQSFLSQAENMGEVVLGFSLGLVAAASGIRTAILVATILILIAALLIAKWTRGKRS